MAIRNVGGLWKKKSKKGKSYLGGLDLKALRDLDPDRTMIMIFVNEKKETEKQPDFSVVAIDVEPKNKPERPQSTNQHAGGNQDPKSGGDWW